MKLRRLSGLTRLACICILLSAPISVIADALTTTDGLSNNSVAIVTQDRYGLMWIGTHDGLNVWDGYEVIPYRHQPGNPNTIPHNSITAMLSDAGGNLWVGTGSGLSCKTSGVQTDVEFTRVLPEGIISIGEDDRGRLWISTDKGVLVIKSDSLLRFHKEFANVPEHLLQGYRIRQFHPAENGSMWAATARHGLLLLEAEDGRARIRREFNRQSSPSLATDHLISVFEASDQKVWVGTEEAGLYYLDRLRNIFVRVPLPVQNKDTAKHMQIMGIHEGSSGHIWVAINGGGVCRLNPHTMDVQVYNTSARPSRRITNDAVICIAEDQSGILWAGTNGGGLNKIETSSLTFYNWSTSPSVPQVGHNIWALREGADGSIRIGSDNGIAEFYPLLSGADMPEEPVFRIKQTWLTGSAVHDILVLDETHLLAATVGKGLAVINRVNGTIEFIKKQVRGKDIRFVYALERDASGQLWAGTHGAGLVRVDLRKQFMEAVSLMDSTSGKEVDWVTALKHNPAGPFLWVGTWGAGLFGLRQNQAAVGHFPFPGQADVSDAADIIFSILPERDNILWIGTYGNGLLRLDLNTRQLKAFTEKDGLANNVVYRIQKSETGLLWLSTNKGITCFDPYNYTCINYGKSDGLLNDEFNLGASLSYRNRLFLFGGTSGIDAFYPERQSNRKAPELLLRNVRVNGRNRTINNQKMVNLGTGIDQVRFSITALHFKKSAQNRYACRLEGYEEDWRVLGYRREVDYNHLPPGTYTFWARAANSDGYWSADTALYSFQIQPPFWRRAWFNLAALAALLTGLWAIYYYRLSRKLAFERIRYEEKNRLTRKLAADFHDELGHRITTISLMSKMLRTKLPAQNDSKVYLDQIIDNADQLFMDLKDFIWELKDQETTIYDIILLIKSFSEELFDHTDIAFEAKLPGQELLEIRLPGIWRSQIVRIFKEGMNNILKHARDCTRASLTVQLRQKILFIELADNGSGFDAGGRANGDGLSNMRERAQSLGGDIIIRSSAEGTRLIFRAKLSERVVSKS